jgi:hypothetical protein
VGYASRSSSLLHLEAVTLDFSNLTLRLEDARRRLVHMNLIFPHPAQILEQTRRPVFLVPFSVQQPSLGLSFSTFVELSLNQFPSLIPPGRPSFSSVVVFYVIFRVFSTGVPAQARKCFPLTPKRALASSLPPAANNSSWHGFLSTRPWSPFNARTGCRCRISGLRFSCRCAVVGLDTRCSILRWPLASSFPRNSKSCTQSFSADHE